MTSFAIWALSLVRLIIRTKILTLSPVVRPEIFTLPPSSIGSAFRLRLPRFDSRIVIANFTELFCSSNGLVFSTANVIVDRIGTSDTATRGATLVAPTAVANPVSIASNDAASSWLMARAP